MVHSDLFRKPRAFALFLGLVLFVSSGLAERTIGQQAQRSPSDTVREFYKTMREKRFRDAFAISIYKPAVEGLKPEEFEDLRPEFEKVAAALSGKIEVTGEQISGDEATVFVKVPKDDDPTQTDTDQVALIRVDGAWVVGDKENQEVVRKAGKTFFFNARIDTHHSEVQAMFQRINLAQLAYLQQHPGLFADMATLIAAGLLPKDLEGTESTGYRFHIMLAKDAKSFTVGAEPAQYGRTGRLSFFMDQSGIRSGDVGGKPLNPPPEEPLFVKLAIAPSRLDYLE